MFNSFDISASALTAQRIRLTTISSNLANVDSLGTKGADGINTPYRRKFTIFEPQSMNGGAGVRVASIQEDYVNNFKRKYEPNSPLRGPDNYVNYPNIDLSTEYVDALETTRAYEANVNAIETTKSMMSATLRVLA